MTYFRYRKMVKKYNIHAWSPIQYIALAEFLSLDGEPEKKIGFCGPNLFARV